MSNYDGRKVIYAKLHYFIHTPETGQFGPTLSDNASGMNIGTPMRVVGDCIEVTARAVRGGAPLVISVPLTGFTHFVLAPDNQSESKAKEVKK